MYLFLYLLLISFGLFFLGLAGLLIFRKNLILLLLLIEILLLSVNLFFVFFSIDLDDIVGQLFSIYILVVAGAESAIGLAIFVAFFRIQHLVGGDLIIFLKG